MKIRIVKNIRGDHNFDPGQIIEVDDLFARQLVSAGGAVEIPGVEIPVEPEAAVIHPPEDAMKKTVRSGGRRQKL